MQLGGLIGGFYRVSEVIMRLAYLNILWFLFVLGGLVIFGVMPATVATFAIIRKWLQKETDIPVFKTFFNSFKKEFIKSNLIGIILFGLPIVIYANYQILTVHVENNFVYMLYGGSLILISLLYGFMCLYIIPVFVHFAVPFITQIKYSIIIGITNFHISLLTLISLYFLSVVFTTIPGLIPFFSISSAVYVIMGGAYWAFRRLAVKQEKLLAENDEINQSA